MAHSQLQGRDITLLVPLGAALVGIGYYLYKNSFCCNNKKSHINLDIKKNEAKIVDTLDIEDIGEQKVFCRCWRSKLFPYCDGSHNKHNAETGDNVGPLIIGKKK